MYNNGLQDPELQQLHKKFKLNINLFLNDIIDSDLFRVIEEKDYYKIYPLFYCDRIETDGEGAFINGAYFIHCPKDYPSIFLFISDSSIVTNETYTITNLEDDYWCIFIYDEWTFQPSRNRMFSVDYGEDNVKQYTTDKLGYCTFISEEDSFEVIL